MALDDTQAKEVDVEALLAGLVAALLAEQGREPARAAESAEAVQG
jgi:hypothetical protein